MLIVSKMNKGNLYKYQKLL